jgi:protein gp37
MKIESEKEIKGKKNIEYANERWHPITGCNIQDCAVKEKKGKCWAELMAIRQVAQGNYHVKDKNKPFMPAWQGDRIINKKYPLIEQPLHWNKIRWIDTCFMGDISCAKQEWILKMLETIEKARIHRFYLLTKNPIKLKSFKFPRNAWVGTTINRHDDLYRLSDLRKLQARIKYISFEPIYEDINLSLSDLNNIDWIILGAQTRPNLQPEKTWVQKILCKSHKRRIPIFIKNNLNFSPKLTEFPKIT